MTEEIKQQRNHRKHRTDSDAVTLGYSEVSYTTNELTHCGVRLRRNVTVSKAIGEDGSLGPEQLQRIDYEIRSTGFSDDRAKLIAMFRQIADDLANHDFGDDD